MDQWVRLWDSLLIIMLCLEVGGSDPGHNTIVVAVNLSPIVNSKFVYN